MTSEESSFRPKDHGAEARERQYTLSISDGDRQHSFEIEDERWSTEEQLRDWVKLGVLVLITLAWHLLVYYLSPGLR